MSDMIDSNAAGFDALRERIDSQFPVGHFVAIHSGDVVADANNHRELVKKVRALGRSPKDLLILQAGIKYPESAIILLDILGYGSDAVVEAAQSRHPDFAGLVGLPLLRMMQYGGDRAHFWIRAAVE